MGATLIAVLLTADDCLRWASMIEIMSQVPQSEWAERRQEWTVGATDKLTRMYVLRAINYIEAGLPASEAWRECGSI